VKGSCECGDKPSGSGATNLFLKKTLPSARFEPANLGSNGRHVSHYTTEDDSVCRS
jgi:hypothetical protein